MARFYPWTAAQAGDERELSFLATLGYTKEDLLRFQAEAESVNRLS